MKKYLSTILSMVFLLGCQGPTTSQNLQNFMEDEELITEQSVNPEDEKSASEVLKMVGVILQGAGLGEFANFANLSGELPLANTDSKLVNFVENEFQTYCKVQNQTERLSGVTSVQKKSYDTQTNPNSLAPGDRLIPCPIQWTLFQKSTSQFSGGEENISSNNGRVVLKIEPLLVKAIDANGVSTYSPKTFASVKEIVIDFTTHNVEKSAKGLRNPGRTLSQESFKISVKYSEDLSSEVLQTAVIQFGSKADLNIKIEGDSKSNTYGRTLRYLKIQKMNSASRSVVVADYNDYRGDLGKTNTLKINGKTKKLNGKPQP